MKKKIILGIIAVILITVLGVILYNKVIAPMQEKAEIYKTAIEFMDDEKYVEAMEEFNKLDDDYKDKTSLVSECEKLEQAQRYELAEKYLSEDNKAMAAITFGSLGGYKDSRTRSFELWDVITPRKTVAADGNITVGVRNNGTVYAIGESVFDSLEEITAWKNIIAIATEGSDTIGLRADGTVIVTNCIDDELLAETDVVNIDANNDKIALLKSDGTVKVYAGYDAANYGEDQTEHWKNIVAVDLGSYHTVGLHVSGKVVAVGKNDNGQCNVSDWSDVVQVSAGGYHTAALCSDGTIEVTGRFSSFLGKFIPAPKTGSTSGTDSEYMKEFAEGWTNIKEVCATDNNIYVLTDDGRVDVCGSGYYEGVKNVTSWEYIHHINGGYAHIIGMKTNGKVKAAGNNNHGELAVSKWSDIRVPNVFGFDYPSDIEIDFPQVAVGTEKEKEAGGNFSNKYGNADTYCVVSGCYSKIASSGDTNCCVLHSNKCLECKCYIDGDAMYCMSCIKSALD